MKKYLLLFTLTFLLLNGYGHDGLKTSFDISIGNNYNLNGHSFYRQLFQPNLGVGITQKANNDWLSFNLRLNLRKFNYDVVDDGFFIFGPSWDNYNLKMVDLNLGADFKLFDFKNFSLGFGTSIGLSKSIDSYLSSKTSHLGREIETYKERVNILAFNYSARTWINYQFNDDYSIRLTSYILDYFDTKLNSLKDDYNYITPTILEIGIMMKIK